MSESDAVTLLEESCELLRRVQGLLEEDGWQLQVNEIGRFLARADAADDVEAKEHCPIRLAGIPQPKHMPCDTGDFSRDGDMRERDAAEPPAAKAWREWYEESCASHDADVEARTVKRVVAHLEAMADAEMAGHEMVTFEQRQVLEHRQLALLAAADEVRQGAWRSR